MWAIVKNGKVEQVFRTPQAFSLNGVSHSKHVMNLWKEEELKKLGLYKYIERAQRIDDTRFYQEPSDNIEYEIDEQDKIVIGVQKRRKISFKAAQQIALEELRTSAYRRLVTTDWYVVRKYEEKKSVPKEISDYRKAVRKCVEDFEKKIMGINNTSAIMVVYEELMNDKNWPTR